ncbi:averantin oxidoreductase, variant [Magnaporthiopsis poae ATCC 64411]|uniref:Averantin oxidoreductase, variant n=1 Tax=Magnaporthiopsis poae (strain ATCC 64411 / 73-15) TaxID=644358 RepID=A0A0C4DY12_MAGP6|nr:averantin oxidoreductase, variant [Magnaporthiopsis poae ATCC 64411]
MAWLSDVWLPGQLLAVFTGLLFTAFVLRAVYYIWLHPLSKYPGPWYAKTTNLIYYVIECRGELIPWICRQHARYGPTVRLGPERLSFTDAAAWADIYGGRGRGANPRVYSFPKDPWWAQVLDSINSEGVPSLATHPSDEQHARLRRIFSPAFSEQALRRQAGMLTPEYMGIVSDPIDMVRVFNYATFDITTELVFGESLGMLADGEYVPWVANVFDSFKAMIYVAFPVARLGPVARFAKRYLLPASLKQLIDSHMRFVRDRVDARLDRKSDQPDLWNLVLGADGKAPLTRHEMYSNAAAFVLAGAETSATLLSALTYLLLKDPQRMRRLVREVRGAFGTEQDMTFEALAQLEYLKACISEGMRIFPPLPASGARAVPREGGIICGDFIPGGVSGTPYLRSDIRLLTSLDPRWRLPLRRLSLARQL